MQKLSTRTLAYSLLSFTIALPVATAAAFAQQAPTTPTTSAQAAPLATGNTQTSSPAPVSSTTSQPPEDKPKHLGFVNGLTLPKAIATVTPHPPDSARAGQPVTVRLSLWVDKNGNPTHIKVVKSGGRDWDKAAIESVQQYKFQPATLKGKPVTVDELYIDINMQLIPPNKPAH